MFKLSRIGRVNIEDLSASENINEITADKIESELDSILKEIVKVDSQNE